MSWNNGEVQMLFGPLRTINIARNKACFPQCENFTTMEWAICIAGEVGEAINAVKKVWIGQGSIASIGDECADVLIYLDLWLARQNLGVLSSAIATNVWYPTPDKTGEIAPRHLADLYFAGADLLATTENAKEPLATVWTRLIRVTTEIMQRAGLDPAEEIVKCFDKVSERKGYPYKLSDPGYLRGTVALLDGKPQWRKDSPS